MGQAIDTVAFFATNPGAGGAAATAATGDSFTVRNFDKSAPAAIEQIIRQGATSGFVRARSPLLHDNVRGIMFTTGDTPARWLFPPDIGQPLSPQDNLTVEISGGAAEVDGGALVISYTNLTGASARLHSWSDISGMIKNVKPVEVDITTNAIAMQWTDTVLTTTENLMHAGSDYAVLGYVVNTACCAVGVKGQDTGNLRVCGWGSTDPSDTSDYFVRESIRGNHPYIPVLAANNRFATFVSVAAVATGTAITVQLILAELTSTLPS